MKLLVKKSNILDILILSTLLLQVMIFYWLDISDYVNYLIIFLIGCAILKDFNYYRKSTAFAYLLLIILYSFFNLVVVRGSVSVLLKNMYKVLRGTLIFSYMFRLTTRNPELVKNFTKRLRLLFNVYAITNVIVLLLQLNGYYSLASRTTTGLAHHLRVDFISGTFGLFMTPALGVFSVFIFIYNYCQIKYFHRGIKSIRLFKLYNYLLLGFNLWISTQNDNKGFYIILILYLTALYLAENTRTSKITAKQQQQIKSNNFRRFLGSAIIILLFILLSRLSYRYFASFRTIVNRALRKVASGLDYHNVRGGGERIGMILYWFFSPRNWLFGFGLGKYLDTYGTLGFYHFGQADLGGFICLGGIIMVLLLIFPINAMLREVLKDKMLSRMILFIYIFLLFYTRIYTRTSTHILSMLVFYLLWMVSQSAHTKKSTVLGDKPERF